MKIAIIGSGSSAFAAAINVVKQGAQVTLIESGTMGGTCVNVGCVPSKIFIRAAHIAHQQKSHHFSGIAHSAPQIQRRLLLEQQQNRVAELRKSKYEDILESNPNISFIKGTARFKDKNTLLVQTEQGEQTVEADQILIATGSTPHIPEINGLKDTPYWDSTDALQSEEFPEHLVVLGGSVIAVELAQAFARLGTKVTLMARSTLLSKEDPDLGQALKQVFESENIRVMIYALPDTITHKDNQFTIQVGTQIIHADRLLVATGRRGNTQKLNLAAVGVETDAQNQILIDAYMRTNIEGIYASGDCTTQPQYVYVAAAAGSHAAVNMLGGNVALDLSIVPAVIFTEPQVATVGMTLAQANRLGLDAESRTLTLDNVPRALANFETEGFIKLVAERGTGRLLGAQILAPEAGEIIQVLTTALHAKMTIDNLASQFFPYLIMGESLKLCAQIFRMNVKELSCCAAVVQLAQHKEDTQEKTEARLQRLLSEFHRLILPPLKQQQSKLNPSGVKVHQAILQGFIEKGRPLTKAEINQLSTESAVCVLERLKIQDLVILDEDSGEVIGAYPMTTKMTPHKVTVGQHQFYAICAFDALAISAMFGKEILVESRCHVTGKQINLKISDDKIISSEPANIYLGIRAQDPGHCAANSICKEMVFLENEAVAQQWKASEKNVFIYTLDDAMQLSIQHFMPLVETDDLAALQKTQAQILVELAKLERKIDRLSSTSKAGPSDTPRFLSERRDQMFATGAADKQKSDAAHVQNKCCS